MVVIVTKVAESDIRERYIRWLRLLGCYHCIYVLLPRLSCHLRHCSPIYDYVVTAVIHTITRARFTWRDNTHTLQ